MKIMTIQIDNICHSFKCMTLSVWPSNRLPAQIDVSHFSCGLVPSDGGD